MGAPTFNSFILLFKSNMQRKQKVKGRALFIAKVRKDLKDAFKCNKTSSELTGPTSVGAFPRWWGIFQASI